MSEPALTSTTPVRVWDLPTRLFHWLLAALVVALVITGNVGGNAMEWHMRCGLAVGALLAFRLVWGLVGGHWSRFARFIYSPATLLRYLRGQGDARLDVGHSPTGALSVFALLVLLGVQVATGLVTTDDIFTNGPLYAYVESATSAVATNWHKGPGKLLLIVLVSLHVAAIVWYRLRGRNLVTPMLTGDKALPAGTPASRDGWGQRLAAAAVLAACAALAWWVNGLGAVTY